VSSSRCSLSGREQLPLTAGTGSHRSAPEPRKILCAPTGRGAAVCTQSSQARCAWRCARCGIQSPWARKQLPVSRGRAGISPPLRAIVARQRTCVVVTAVEYASAATQWTSGFAAQAPARARCPALPSRGAPLSIALDPRNRLPYTSSGWISSKSSSTLMAAE